MLTRGTVIKLIVFAVIGVLGIGYTFWQYGGGKSVFPGSTYTVKMRMVEGGGIFSNAEVSYRGVKVGRVSGMHLTDDGVEVDLRIDSSAPAIPADVQAQVRNLSAVGEQYVDLRPQSSGGPYLADLPAAQRVIEPRHTGTPPSVQQLVNNLDALANSVPRDSLRTTVDELYTAFHDTGGDLQQLMDTADSFLDAAQRNLPQTTALLDSGRTVLDTQNDEASALRSFSGNLRSLAAQLKSSDPDLRHLIAATPRAARALDTVLRESGQHLSVLLANLLTTSRVVAPRLDGLEMAFIVYPMIPATVPSVVGKDGKAHLGLVLNLFNPPPCVRGYQGTNRRPGDVTSTQPVNTDAYCAEPSTSPVNVRGSQNAPYAGKPVAPARPGSVAPAPQRQSSLSQQQQQPGLFSFPSLGPSSLAELMGVG